VRDWQALWKPETVRTLLVAESHLREQHGDLDLRVRGLPEKLYGQPLPTGFCKSVQCLSWGLPALTSDPDRLRDRNTHQFWDLLGAVADLDAANLEPSRKGRPDPTATLPPRPAGSEDHQLQWRLGTMDKVRRRGVWLVDACVAGIKVPGAGRFCAGANYRTMVRDSYLRFVWPLVEKEPLEQLWVIGKGTTAVALEGLPLVEPGRVMYQPRQVREHRADVLRLVESLRG